MFLPIFTFVPHGFYSTGGILVVKIPSKKEKCVSGDSFAITYPITFRFCRLTVGEFLFVFNNDFCFVDIRHFVNLDVSNCRKIHFSGERVRKLNRLGL